MKNFSTQKFNLSLNFNCVVLFILLLPLYPIIYGQNIPWVKHPGNPVLDVGVPGSWDDEGVGFPCVIFENDTFHMWYSGYNGTDLNIGYATSLDGIYWEKDTVNNPVLTHGQPPDWDAYEIYTPMVVKVDNVYHMWYSGAAIDDQDNIGHATSSDRVHWDEDPENPVILRGEPQSWDMQWVVTPFVIFQSDTFHMWYSGAPNISNVSIGYATSTDPYGKNWTKDTLHNPILSPVPGNWDYPRIEYPSISSFNDTLYMFYTGGNYNNRDIGFATSTDKVNWYKNPLPCLRRGDSGKWDYFRISTPCVLFDGITGEYKMWYTGQNMDGDGKIGLATVSTLIVDVEEVDFSPADFVLDQNYPNPFNPTTIIGYGIKERSNVKITILNLVGEEVAVLVNENKDSGYHTIEFNSTNLTDGKADLPSGVYFYQLRAGDYAAVKKMILLK
jgi:predicted GH43/DUF377 family glycosyl hydrolase